MHEHALLDARVWATDQSAPISEKVTMAVLGQLRWDVMSMNDNLVLDDPAIALREMTAARQAGLSGFVDLTNVGTGRRPLALVELARASGLHVMVGCGFYIHGSHPAWIEDASIDTIAATLIDELDSGIEDSGIRPAIIGEIGTSDPLAPCEERVLRAAGRAASQWRRNLIHLDGRGTKG